jgi:hypothetical protein
VVAAIGPPNRLRLPPPLNTRSNPVVGVNAKLPPAVDTVAVEPLGEPIVNPALPLPESNDRFEAPVAVNDVALPKVILGVLKVAEPPPCMVWAAPLAKLIAPKEAFCASIRRLPPLGISNVPVPATVNLAVVLVEPVLWIVSALPVAVLAMTPLFVSVPPEMFMNRALSVDSVTPEAID